MLRLARARAIPLLPLNDLPEPFVALVFVLGPILVGRVVLAWLPPGRLGAHAPRELPSTLAGSLVLSWALSLTSSRIAGAVGLESVFQRAFLPTVALAGLLRWLTLPAAFVPTPPPRILPAPWIYVALQCMGAAGLIVYMLLPGNQADWIRPSVGLGLVTAVTYLALPALLDHALRELEVPGSLRTLVWAVPFALIWVLPDSLIPNSDVSQTPLMSGAGFAFAVVARKRADRRALAFSAIAFGLLATRVAGWPLAFAGLAGLALFGPGSTLLERSIWPIASAVAFAPWAWEMRDYRPGGTTYFAAVAVPIALFVLLARIARGWRLATA